MHTTLIAHHPLLATLFWLSFYGWFFFFETWVSARDKRAKVTELHTDARSATFLLVMFYVGIGLSFIAAFLLPQFTLPHRMYFFVGGIMLIWGGVAFRYWSIKTLGKYFRTLVLIQDDHRLISDGPYRYLRHPAYAGTLVSVLGVGLALGNSIGVSLMVLCALFGYVRRIYVEEAALKRRFREKYDAYHARTWHLIPFVW